MSYNRILYINAQEQIAAPCNNMLGQTDIMLSGKKEAQRTYNMIRAHEIKEQAKVVGDRVQDGGDF